MNPRPFFIAGLLIITGVFLLYQPPVVAWVYSLSLGPLLFLFFVVVLVAERLIFHSKDVFIKRSLECGLAVVCCFLFIRSCSLGIQKINQLAEERTPPRVVVVPTPSPRESKRPSSSVSVSPPVSSPTPLPSFGIKQLSEQAWRVTLPEGRWYDTGIPVIANIQVHIKSATPKGKFMVEVGQKQMFCQEGKSSPAWRDIILAEQDNGNASHLVLVVDYEFRDTIRLKIDDEGGERAMILQVELTGRDDPCRDLGSRVNPNIHHPAQLWAAQMRENIARH